MEGSFNHYLQGKVVLSKKSWTAYVMPVIFSTVMLVFLAPMNILFSLFPFLYLVYEILMIKSYELYSDDDGVWLYRGIFPWNKGISGVKWRDIDEAAFAPNFMSWALKSYTIKVSHRFTKDRELLLRHMELGDNAVIAINDKHKTKF